ncbi:CobW family GTP-binding protein [Actinokineospora globicatena]|uniref:CobW family GTP-binding protein n=1 Tax=Actinokineospora globicatena TaxID=103729 RepID=UPI0020A3CED0|nr:GTP-binding protein [Actinokineospora globicatena]MCP2305338.1 GTPase, G3E family [Actinokineospora globicatena]GLW80815.1 cobalamin biosynthesis protein CobW [Actinokineospora globicatena]GLW87642.1 cobalamin biosynthesis protein CobW [Actinokineospora globicatena]
MDIPVLVVAGFLGAGKTTLLNHLLRTASGLRVGVIVNDFGKVNIDALTVAAQVDSMVSLGNGCLCCAVDPEDLDAMLDRLAHPDGPVDVIVIEASGLAEPPAMVKMLLASANPHIRYAGLVEVVDAAEFTETRRTHPRLDLHLRQADLVLLNKADRAGPGVLELVRELAEGTPVVPTEYGRVDPALLFDPVDRPDPVERQLSFEDLVEHEEHLHAGYASIEFGHDEPLHPLRFARFLTERPAGLYRMKGFAWFAGTDGALGVQTVGSSVWVTPVVDAGRRTDLVLIGAELDAAAITAELTAAVVTADDTVDPLDLLSITRYQSSVD